MPDSVNVPAKSTSKIDIAALTRTGPGTLAGRYMRMFWHPIWIGEDLKPGQTFTVKVMSEELTLYRGHSGKAYVIDNKCAHRSVQLSVGSVVDDCVMCLYHGWKYDGTGQCVEQPAEGNENFARKVRIKSYPVREHLGLIFIYMGKGEPPPLPHLPDFEDDVGFLHWQVYTRDCNYFQNIENAVDEAHVPFTHVDTFDILNFDIPDVYGKETDYGLIQYAHRNNGIAREQMLVMPNIMVAFDARVVSGEEWSFRASWRVPVDDASHKNFSLYRSKLSPAHEKESRARDQKRAAILAGLEKDDRQIAQDIIANKIRLHDPEVKSRPDYFSIQDHVAQCAQGSIVDRHVERLGRSDRAIILLRKLWLRDLRAIASGKRPRQWKLPDRFPRVSGV